MIHMSELKPGSFNLIQSVGTAKTINGEGATMMKRDKHMTELLFIPTELLNGPRTRRAEDRHQYMYMVNGSCSRVVGGSCHLEDR